MPNPFLLLQKWAASGNTSTLTTAEALAQQVSSENISSSWQKKLAKTIEVVLCSLLAFFIKSQRIQHKMTKNTHRSKSNNSSCYASFGWVCRSFLFFSVLWPWKTLDEAFPSQKQSRLPVCSVPRGIPVVPLKGLGYKKSHDWMKKEVGQSIEILPNLKDKQIVEKSMDRQRKRSIEEAKFPSVTFPLWWSCKAQRVGLLKRSRPKQPRSAIYQPNWRC